MFDRFESFKKAIEDKSIDYNTLQLMIDFHVLKGTLTEEQGNELFNLMYPEEESEEVAE
ncbi:hypothetical protein [Clostridium thermosuccinogenes]|uniref:hypothetical protein n=1 Tax=Clostridium thermosuccinogenes TaxID=84032 RepID=UPI00137AD4AC|nr:hypothetical protein [Pseudoclostridium thermosuccinogenes]